MAVIIEALSPDTNRLELGGIVHDGEFFGDEDIGHLLSGYNLDSEKVERELDEKYSGTHLHATRVDDDEINIEELRAKLP